MSSDSTVLLDFGSLTDEELLLHAKAGEQDAMAVLVNRYQRMLWNVAAKIVQDSTEAEDVVQAVFMDLFQKMDLFDPYRGTVKTWLLQIAHNRSINRRHYLLRRRFYDRSNLEGKIAHVASPARGAYGLARSEARRLIREVLETLPRAQRTAIELIHFEGLTFGEVAMRTNQTLSAAKHQYYRAVLKLRGLITGEQNVPAIHSDLTASSACGFVFASREDRDAFAA